MSFEEEFDKIIRQKTDGAEFPFDEKNWEKARKMLDSEREAVGFVSSAKFYIAAVLILTVATAGYFIYDGMMKPEAVQTIAIVPTFESSVPENSISENSRHSDPAGKPVTPDSDAASADVTSENKIASQPLVNAPSTINKAISKENSSVSSEKISKPEVKIVVTKTAKQTPNSTDAPAGDPIEKSNVSENLATTATPDLNTDKRDLDKDVKVSLPSIAAKSENKVDKETESAAVNQLVAGSLKDKQEETASGNASLSYEALSMNVPKWETAVNDPEINIAPLNTLNYYDDDYYTPEKYKRYYLNAEAGGNYLFGWSTKKGRDGQGLNFFGGINYGYYITKKLDVSAGVQVYNTSNINQAFFNYSKTEFDFSALTTQTLITTNSLYYAAIPVKVTYALNSQNQIGVGCNIGLLMSSQNTVDTYFYRSDVRTDKTSVKTVGYYEGMNTTNIMLSVFYRSKLGKRLYLNGEATFTPSNIYKYTKTDINTANTLGLRLSLQYTLFEK